MRGSALGAARHRHGAHATLPRSVALFRAFRAEQTDPARFYRTLAADLVTQLAAYGPLDGRTVLDVGGGPGYFRDAFRAAGARWLSVDADLGELSLAGPPGPGVVLGSALALPLADASVDVCYSSNLLEHVRDAERAADEMVRVTRPGGLMYLSYTNWLSPWGGHETSPWHYLGGSRAVRRYRRTHGFAPKNEYGRTLFPLSAARMLRWAHGTDHAELLEYFPRYHPAWAYPLAAVPVLREFVVWNLVVVMRRR